VGEPLKIMLLEVFEALLVLPAANNRAGVAATAEVLVVLTLCEMVRLPLSACTEIVSVELRPLYVVPPTVTEPICRAPAFTTVNAPTALDDAMTDNALLVLLKVMARVPTRAKP